MGPIEAYRWVDRLSGRGQTQTNLTSGSNVNAECRKVINAYQSMQLAAPGHSPGGGRVPTRTGLTPSTRAAMQSSVTIDLTKPDALTHESVARLLASASDGTNTQLRVTKEGVAFISSTD